MLSALALALALALAAGAPSDDYVLPMAVNDIYRTRGYELPRLGAPPAHAVEDAELGRGFAGNIKSKLEALQAQEGIERRGIGETPTERAAQQHAHAQRTLGA